MLSIFPCPKLCHGTSKASFPKHRNYTQHPFTTLHSKSRTIINGVQAIHASTNSSQETEKYEEVVKQDAIRVKSNFSPDIWGDLFSSFSLDNQMVQNYAKEIEWMKEEVKSMLMATDLEPVEKIILIDTLEHLGLSYHFENEIEEQLESIFCSNADSEDDDLHTLALKFRVFRQHGFYMPCDAFDKFRNHTGDFNEILINDIKGMLSLYEAAHLRIHGETTLEEALAFTALHLKALLTQIQPDHLAKQVKNALEHPFHKGMQKIEARYYISLYEEGKFVNETLLRFAKIDFNLGQLLYKQELCELKRWSKELYTKMDYARDRSVELYFFMSGVIFEPCYSAGRIAIAKAAILLVLIDDTYESYGTLEELKIFTNVIKRWDIDASHKLPNCLQLLYENLLDYTEDIENKMFKLGRPCSAHPVKVMIEDLTEAFYIDSKWFLEGRIPSFDEYMSNSVITTCYRIISCLSFMFVGENADVEAIDWLQSNPKVLRAAETYCRILDDRTEYEEEKGRERLLSSISCYIKEHDMSEEDVIDEFHKMLEDAWKDANEGCLKPNLIPMHLLVRIINLMRAITVLHQYGDGLDHPEKLRVKDHIVSLFIDPIPL